ncbi:transcription initiation factor TFB [Haloterrigena sp. H1]|nr:transcription initiation factor TFB [Haloterrigena sp. H1]
MIFREIYQTTFDEDVQPNSSTSLCPNCNGRVITNAVETRCEDCGLLIEPQHYQTQKGSITLR